MVGGWGGVGGRIGLLAEIDSLARSAAGGLVYHAIAAEIPLDIAPKTPLREITGESDSEPNPSRCSRDQDQSYGIGGFAGG